MGTGTCYHSHALHVTEMQVPHGSYCTCIRTYFSYYITDLPAQHEIVSGSVCKTAHIGRFSKPGCAITDSHHREQLHSRLCDYYIPHTNRSPDCQHHNNFCFSMQVKVTRQNLMVLNQTRSLRMIGFPYFLPE